MIKLTALYSGSKGNSYLISANGTHILLDAGRSAKALVSALIAQNADPSALSAILITHEHSDHVSALRVLTSKYALPIYGAVPVLSAVCENDAMRRSANPVIGGVPFKLGEITVDSCFVPHDSAACLAYRFTDTDGTSIAVATDMGTVTAEAEELCSGATVAVLESNHDPEMLKLGKYPPSLKARILSDRGHLSNAACATFSESLAQSGAAAILLAHISRENNTPKLAYDTTRASLDRAGHTGTALAAIGETGGISVTADGGTAVIDTKDTFSAK